MPTPDTGLFRAINEWPDSLSPFLTFFSVAMNQAWVKLVLGILLIAMIATKRETRRTAIQALIAVGIANSFTEVFKHLWPMHRPYQDMTHVINRVGTSSMESHGTASAHSANMAAVALIFFYHLKWWGSPWVLVAVLTGFSRVYVGAHYPYQVLLGWICGLAAAFLVAKGWDVLKALRTRPSEASENT